MESEYATAFSVLCGERVPDAGPEPDLVRIGTVSSACGIFLWNLAFVGAGYFFGDAAINFFT